MNIEASHSSLLEETKVEKITTAMEEEERALHKETSREQQQMMDKVENCTSLGSFQLLFCLRPNRHKNFHSCAMWLFICVSRFGVCSVTGQGCSCENTKVGSLASSASYSGFGNSRVDPSDILSHSANLNGLSFHLF